MRDQRKHLPVNWIDGMKINKNHFIQQDSAWTDALQEVCAMNLSPIQFGILPRSSAGEESFNVKLSADNQNTLRVLVYACQGVTPGGACICVPAFSDSYNETENLLTTTYTFPVGSSESIYWIILTVQPQERIPVGSDTGETPPRLPYVIPSYKVQVVSDNQIQQYLYHPYSLVIGKVYYKGNEIVIDHEYIPPCCYISSHSDLLELNGEIDQFLSNLEIKCSQIVQKIFQKNQQNDISKLVMFLCDRIVLYLSSAITNLRMRGVHMPPVSLISEIAVLSRIIKNSIDLRIGSGKDEMLNYFSVWSELRQGELETLLISTATIEFDQNDINKSIQKVVRFVSVITKLFDTLSKLDFIGEQQRMGLFVKEEVSQPAKEEPKKPARRFFSS